MDGRKRVALELSNDVFPAQDGGLPPYACARTREARMRDYPHGSIDSAVKNSLLAGAIFSPDF